MSSPVKVCVIIPTYNQANLIEKAVTSALEQDHPFLSILVSDDCSTDNTLEVLKKFSGFGNVAIFSNPANLGRVANYRHALYELADAEWVVNLDGDDYFADPNFISQAVAAITENGRDEVLFYQAGHIIKTGSQETIALPQIEKETEVLRADDYYRRFPKIRHFSHLTTVFRRSMAVQSDFYSKNITSSDVFSFLKCALQNPDKKIILAKKPSAVWLQHSSNASSNAGPEARAENFAAYRSLYRLAIAAGFTGKKLLRWRYFLIREKIAGLIKQYFK